MSDDIQDHLQAYLQTYCEQAFPAWRDVQVTDVVSVSEGWESDVYSFELTHGPGGAREPEGLILRIYPGDDAGQKSAREFQGMRQLHRAGYPVPEVLALERERSPFGKPFVIMERIEGRMLWPVMFEPSVGKRRQGKLLTLFCELFVQLHALDWRPFVGRDEQARYGNPYTFVDNWLDQFRGFLARSPVPGFTSVMAWLEERRGDVPCSRPAVVHLDYHPANVLLRDDGSAVVIDWTQVGVDDPRLDLAWTLLLICAYEGPGWRTPVLAEYERLAGFRVEGLAYFDVLACAKRLGSVVVSLLEGPERMGMRPEAVAMMRQQMGPLGRVYDLLVERTDIRVPEIEGLLAANA
jgi:aminoglycoside phosphotransferase (APT) family kinase protein